jgi:hypothetical protein
MTLGRVALKNPNGFVSVNDKGNVMILDTKKPTDAETFQWTELEEGHLVLLSIATHRYLQNNGKGNINALVNIPSPNQKDNTRFDWLIVELSNL